MLPSVFGEKLFDDMFNDAFTLVPAFHKNPSVFSTGAKNLMKTDVRELENTYELDIDLPGFKKEEVNIELDKGYLTIAGRINRNFFMEKFCYGKTGKEG